MRRTQLPIANPCHEDWRTMDPVARGRFCRRCDKQVHDLSAMTEPQAREFLAEPRDSKICVRYACDGAGNVRFSPLRVAAVALALAACTPHGPGPTDQSAVMGKIEAPQPYTEVMGEPSVPPPPAPPDDVVMGDLQVLEPQPPADEDPAPKPAPASPTLIRL
jgi:hypothetical protein